MTLDTSNPLYFLIDCMRSIAGVLLSYEFPGIGVPIWTFFIGFIFIGMVISTFWRGARG